MVLLDVFATDTEVHRESAESGAMLYLGRRRHTHTSNSYNTTVVCRCSYVEHDHIRIRQKGISTGRSQGNGQQLSH
jgi:hypothetical protein